MLPLWVAEARPQLRWPRGARSNPQTGVTHADRGGGGPPPSRSVVVVGLRRALSLERRGFWKASMERAAHASLRSSSVLKAAAWLPQAMEFRGRQPNSISCRVMYRSSAFAHIVPRDHATPRGAASSGTARVKVRTRSERSSGCSIVKARTRYVRWSFPFSSQSSSFCRASIRDPSSAGET